MDYLHKGKELEQLLGEAIDKFRKKIADDENLRNEMSGVTRKIQIEIIDQGGFSFVLDNGDVKDFKRGTIEEPDATIIASESDFIALFKGELKPMKAWATKRLKVQASLSDLLKLKKFF